MGRLPRLRVRVGLCLRLACLRLHVPRGGLLHQRPKDKIFHVVSEVRPLNISRVSRSMVKECLDVFAVKAERGNDGKTFWRQTTVSWIRTVFL